MHAFSIRLLSVLLGLFMMAAAAHAQLDPYSPAYVVVAEADTLRGYVQDTADLQRTLRIRFRDESGAEAVFTPSSVLAYGFADGRRFVSRTLPPGPDFAPQPLFLQVLVSGVVNLFGFSFEPPAETRSPSTLHTVKENRFAVEFGAQILPLYESWRPEEPGPAPTRYIVDRQYRRGMAIAFGGCPRMQDRATRLRYAQSSLISAVASYHECVGEDYVVATADGLARRGSASANTMVQITTGVKRIAYKPGSMGTLDPGDVRGGWGATITAAMKMNLRLAGVAPQFSIPFGLFGSYTRTDDAFLTDHSSPGRFFSASDFDRLSLGASAGLRYYLDREGPSYLAIGLTGARAIGAATSARYDQQLESGWRLTFERRMPSYQAGWYLEAGTRLTSFSRLAATNIGVRYDLTGLGGINPLLPFNADWRVSTLSASVGIDL
jgi:hypothetical protein